MSTHTLNFKVHCVAGYPPCNTLTLKCYDYDFLREKAGYNFPVHKLNLSQAV